MMAYNPGFSRRLTPMILVMGVAGLILDFHYGGEIVLEIFLKILLFIGQAVLTGWLTVAALFYFAYRVLFARRRS